MVNQDIETFRANVYLILAHLFIEPPSEHLLNLIRSSRTFSEDNGLWGKAWTELVNVAKRHTLASVEKEFHKLFVGINRGELLPYASWYLTGYLHESPLVALRSEMRILGISNFSPCTEPEDHISLICEVMSILISNLESRQKYFFNKFLFSWVDNFFDDLIKSQSSDFYKAAGSFGRHFICMEQAYLETGGEN